MRIGWDIAAGVVSDDTPFSTPGCYADADKVRPWRGRMQTIGGWSPLPGAALAGVCRNILAWKDRVAAEIIAFGAHSHLHILRGGALHDVTPDGLPHGAVTPIDRTTIAGWAQGRWGDGPWGGGPLVQTWPRTWSLATYGESLLASPRGKGLYWWRGDPAVKAQKIVQAPRSILALLVTPQRQVLALGCQEEASGQFNPMCIRGADIENPEDWQSRSDNNAFEHVLEGGGRIVGARMLGDFVLVWTDAALHLGQFVGMADQTYRFDVIAGDCGLAAPNAAVVVGQTAYWLTPALHVYAFTPGAPPVMLPCPVRNGFVANLDTVAMGAVSRFGEVWLLYPDLRDGGDVSRYLSFSVADQVWSKGTLARTAIADRPDADPVMAASDQVYAHEQDTPPEAWFVETTPIALGEGDRRLFVSGVWPDFEDQRGAVMLELIAQDHPQANPRRKGPYPLHPGREKRDLRIDARLIAVRLSGQGSAMRLGRLSFEARDAGVR